MCLVRARGSCVENLQAVVERHVESGCASPLLFLLSLGQELFPLAGHEVERASFGESHLHPLKKVELPREVSLTLRVHGRFLHVPKKSSVSRPVDRVAEP